MGLFGFMRGPDINEGLEEYDNKPDALLLDVRTPQEYEQGHIPGSRNIPLQRIDKVSAFAGSKNVPLFVYCRSGARSRQAVGILEQMGYTYVKNLGGIADYHGKVEC